MHQFFSDTSLAAQKEKRILKQIYQHRYISRPELLKSNNYKIATLYRTIDTLITKNLAVALKPDDSINVGRPSDILTVNSTLGYILAVMVSRTIFSVALVDFSNNLLAKRTYPINETVSPQVFRDTCYDTYLNILKECEISDGDILGIAISCIGPIDIKNGIVKKLYSFKGYSWTGYHIVDDFSSKFRKKVMVDNNARSAVVGKYVPEFINKYADLSYILVEEGIGSGIILNNSVIKGTNRIINGLGHMRVDVNGKKCYCGNYGCVEAYSSINAIIASVLSELKIGKPSLLTEKTDSLTFSDICAAVKANDGLATSVIEDAAYIFSIGLENFLNIVDVEIVFLGGMLIENCDLFYEIVAKSISKRLPSIVIERDDNYQDTMLRGVASLFVLDLLS